MKKILSISFITTSIFFINQANAQDIIAGNADMHPSFVDFKNAPPKFNKGAVLLASENGRIEASSKALFNNMEKDELGIEHYRYQQTFAGDIPVENAVYVMHVKGESVLMQNGKWVSKFPADLKTTAGLNQKEALNFALNKVAAQSYKWQNAGEEAFYKQQKNDPQATYYPKGKLVFYSGEADVIPSRLKLAYKFDIYAEKPLSRQFVFVDANTGAILGTREIIHTVNAPGIAATAYSGTKNITTDLFNGTYRLRETGRGDGIQTFNMQNGTEYGLAVDFTDKDNKWNNQNAQQDQYATDAHWATEMTYDYFFKSFKRNSVDNKGFILRNYVHFNLVAANQGFVNNINAFWNEGMTYGDGGVSGNDVITPLTALDIAGHEITHGLTQNTSNLTYYAEPGALNEGFSDIFGTAIEFFAKPASANWLVGENIGVAFRSMSNPNQYGQPDTYKGNMWYNGELDQAGVHTNSGVLNFWFYLLTQGGIGINDFGTNYNVTGIGFKKAAAIAYRTNVYYLGPTDGYTYARQYAVKAAEDLYGVGSPEAIQTLNAWIAVGVGLPAPPNLCTDVYEPNNLLNTASVVPTNTNLFAKISSAKDLDWYKFTTTANAPKIQVTLKNLASDYDVILYNSNGNKIAGSLNPLKLDETFNYNNANIAATYYVKVFGYGEGYYSDNCYTLKIATSGAPFNINPIVQSVNGISKKAETSGTLNVYPNPVANGRVNVQFNNQTTAGSQQIVVTDLMGKTIFTKSVNVAEGMNTLNVQLPKLAGGVYVLKIGEMVSRITVQ